MSEQPSRIQEWLDYIVQEAIPGYLADPHFDPMYRDPQQFCRWWNSWYPGFGIAAFSFKCTALAAASGDNIRMVAEDLRTKESDSKSIPWQELLALVDAIETEQVDAEG